MAPKKFGVQGICPSLPTAGIFAMFIEIKTPANSTWFVQGIDFSASYITIWDISWTFSTDLKVVPWWELA